MISGPSTESLWDLLPILTILWPYSGHTLAILWRVSGRRSNIGQPDRMSKYAIWSTFKDCLAPAVWFPKRLKNSCCPSLQAEFLAKFIYSKVLKGVTNLARVWPMMIKCLCRCSGNGWNLRKTHARMNQRYWDLSSQLTKKPIFKDDDNRLYFDLGTALHCTALHCTET